MLWNGAEALSVPSENFKIIPEKFLITGAIGIVCLYASSYGIKELSRAGVITAALGVICLAVMILGAASEWKWSNINLQVSSQSFIKELSRSFAISGGVGIERDGTAATEVSQELTHEEELRKSIDGLKQSLEQIAASRAVTRTDVKTVSPKSQENGSSELAHREFSQEDLKFLGELLQEYLT